MKRVSYLLAVSAVLLAGCEKDTTAAPTPVEPAPAPAASVSTLAAPNATASAYAAMKKSSVCRGYENKRTGLANAISKASPNAQGLAQQKARLAALDVIIKDACQ